MAVNGFAGPCHGGGELSGVPSFASQTFLKSTRSTRYKEGKSLFSINLFKKKRGGLFWRLFIYMGEVVGERESNQHAPASVGAAVAAAVGAAAGAPDSPCEINCMNRAGAAFPVVPTWLPSGFSFLCGRAVLARADGHLRQQRGPKCHSGC